MSSWSEWPEPIVPVQCLYESGITTIPERYVKRVPGAEVEDEGVNIPLIDLKDLDSSDGSVRNRVLERISEACREWGFFQVVGHGVDHGLMADMQAAWREFFRLPLEEKQEYGNSPATYEGYGSRQGVEKGAKLDWNDYFFLHFLPNSIMDTCKWPHLPVSCRELIAKYCEEVANLGDKLTRILSVNLGLKEDRIHEAFGGHEERAACLRVNFYPKCSQPDLAMGLSPHSDPGGLTFLLVDADVAGLQIFHGDKWITVKPLPNAFIINIGDQIQVMTNDIYKSVEHRVMANSEKERLSMALFYNPGGDVVVKPLEEVVSKDKPAMYPAMTYYQYRTFIMTKGLKGKSQLESLKKSKS
ncbi:probable 2-oxoglutarate-dependent dioxygenase At5g05600 [Ipomoea triloba]|uniref:probable 2-oxoglutarate-dependent dioxygenase At5g05600 n=1 Tax=Ipomoea triloba TaxID=35885 RepID=UPI00125DAEE6|nr:probable 2-oxoglutarate-dependent dioxygenase At5g05600 [Ipomoea triloba]